MLFIMLFFLKYQFMGLIDERFNYKSVWCIKYSRKVEGE